MQSSENGMENKEERSSSAVEVHGTVHQNNVAMRDLVFWLPLTHDRIREGIPKVRTFKELVALPKAQIGHILGITIEIIRAN